MNIYLFFTSTAHMLFTPSPTVSFHHVPIPTYRSSANSTKFIAFFQTFLLALIYFYPLSYSFPNRSQILFHLDRFCFVTSDQDSTNILL